MLSILGVALGRAWNTMFLLFDDIAVLPMKRKENRSVKLQHFFANLRFVSAYQLKFAVVAAAATVPDLLPSA